MAEISINEYVRTKQGYIAKVIYVEYDEIDKGHRELDICTFDKPIYYDYGEGYYNLYDDEEFEEIIANHSKNIIDLIEIGDYVNGIEVIDSDGEYITVNKSLFDGNSYRYREYSKEEIKSIVTKEMFLNAEYRVGEQV